MTAASSLTGASEKRTTRTGARIFGTCISLWRVFISTEFNEASEIMAALVPSVFIGSSVEGLEIAEAIQRGLRYAADVELWDQATFDLSSTTIESLEAKCAAVDFAIFVLTPD